MDLWIRSQDKERLLKVNNKVSINEIGIFFVDDKQIATYKTKERALEVLDEIQNLLFTRVMCRADITDDEANLLFCKETQGKLIPDTMLYAKPINLNSIVYQMPKK